MTPLPLLQQIVSHTPGYVRGILLLCIAMGAMQRPALAEPAACLSGLGLTVGALCGALSGLFIARARNTVRYDKRARGASRKTLAA